MFAGGGLKSYGAVMAGCDLVGAVEFDEDICRVYARNVSPLITCARVEDVDYRQFAGIDGGMASPVCKNASVAKSGGKETEVDIASATATARFIREARPRWFMLENVWGYRLFQSFAIILDALTECGYTFDFNRLNSADFAVPQTRIRLILRAVRGFKYTSKVEWVKMCQDGKRVRCGTGYRVLGATEPLLIATRGDAYCPPAGQRLPGVIIAPRPLCPIKRRMKHSAKPEAQWAYVEQYPGPRLELFARSVRPGWTALGNEIDGQDIRDSLPALARRFNPQLTLL